MKLYLINPNNQIVNLVKVKKTFWLKYRVWKPLALMYVAALTPAEWEVTVIDENLEIPDYEAMELPDLVGLTGITSQANRAYKLAAYFRARGVPAVMGGIHASMRREEALEYVDTVAAGEAEGIWEQILEDFKRGEMKRVYEGAFVDADKIPPARHDILPARYFFGSIQTTRGCPLGCSFCSVSQFNGKRYRRRPIENVVEEIKMIPEKYVLFTDDNLIGTSRENVAHAKSLFRAMIAANLGKKWIAQATVNMADDVELLELAARAGCVGIFIGFETPQDEGLEEVSKKFNTKNRNLEASVKQMRQKGIVAHGSFIVGLDSDNKSIGRMIFETCERIGIYSISVSFLTPFPGTRVWERLEAQGRLITNNYPDDWQYYTFCYPVSRYKNLSWSEAIEEIDDCYRNFFAIPRILRRTVEWLFRTRSLTATMVMLAVNFACRNTQRMDSVACRDYWRNRGECEQLDAGPSSVQ